MLASIITYSGNCLDEDILIFLNGEDIKNLKSQTLEGTIFEYRAVWNTHPLEFYIDWRQATTFEIEVGSREYKVSISDLAYSELEHNRKVGGVYGNHKIDIVCEEAAKQDRELERWLKSMNLKWKKYNPLIKS